MSQPTALRSQTQSLTLPAATPPITGADARAAVIALCEATPARDNGLEGGTSVCLANSTIAGNVVKTVKPAPARTDIEWAMPGARKFS